MRAPTHEEILPDHVPPIPMPESRLEALWLLLYLDTHCADGPPPANGTVLEEPDRDAFSTDIVRPCP